MHQGKRWRWWRRDFKKNGAIRVNARTKHLTLQENGLYITTNVYSNTRRNIWQTLRPKNTKKKNIFEFSFAFMRVRACVCCS